MSFFFKKKEEEEKERKTKKKKMSGGCRHLLREWDVQWVEELGPSMKQFSSTNKGTLSQSCALWVVIGGLIYKIPWKLLNVESF